MDLEKELKLSFYKEIAEVDRRHNVSLVQHADTGKIYVKKTLEHFDTDVFRVLKERRFNGVPVIKEMIESDGSLIVIEDYISGHSIDEMLGMRTFSEEETAFVISKLCDILEPMHLLTPPIIHRDIKASNVIIANEGKVYLIDFDASKVVTYGQKRDTDLLGTEQYAAPEQYGFGQSDCRTDIYALGVLMNKMLTGKFPSEELHGGVLARVIANATEIDPVNRYQSVRSLKNAVLSAVPPIAQGDRIAAEPARTNGPLTPLLSKLPYPIRELPGLRSGKILNFLVALAGYSLLIALGFFHIAPSENMTPLENKFYDVEGFILIFTLTLYLGNYLGVRDRRPWLKSQRKGMEILRICAGSVLLIFIVVVIGAILAAIFLQ